MTNTYPTKVSASSTVNLLRAAGSVAPVKTPEQRLGEMIRRARESEAAGFQRKQEAAAKALRIKPPYLSRLESGKGVPSIDLLERIADTFHTELGPMLKILAEIERAKLDPRIREVVSLPAVDINVKPKEAREEARFPVYGLASCGAAVEAIKNDRTPSGEERFTSPWPEALEAAKSKKAFVVEAAGESMLEAIRPGDELLVDPKAKLSDGDVALVQWEGVATIKRWRVVGGTILLTPDNPDRKKFPEQQIRFALFDKGNGTAWRVVLARSTRRL